MESEYLMSVALAERVQSCGSLLAVPNAVLYGELRMHILSSCYTLPVIRRLTAHVRRKL